MGLPILIIGETGSGKTRSILNLNSKETFIINVSDKPFPHKELFKNYKELTKENPNGNLIATNQANTIIETIKYVSDKRPEVKSLVIDDNQYVSSFEYFRRVYERDYYQKYTDIGVNMFNIIMSVRATRKDLKVFILNHLDELADEKGIVHKIKAKTLGRVIDNKLTYEGLFTIVLGTEVEEMNEKLTHFFVTQSNGVTTFKSPEGMFETLKIPNDLQLVVDAIDNYYK